MTDLYSAFSYKL